MVLMSLLTPRVVQAVNKQLILDHVKGHKVAAHKNLLFGLSNIVKLLNLIIST